MPENILIIGSGAREHALGFKLQAEGHTLTFSPGNAGTAEIGQNISYTSPTDLARWARTHDISLAVVGPENRIAEGITEAFTEEAVPVFAPSKQAAQLETSKDFALEFMQRHTIPHPHSIAFTDALDAFAYLLQTNPQEIVIKADGLAAGKGVILPATQEEAHSAVQMLMLDKTMGEAGEKIVIQERLSGPEISILAFCDGEHVVAMPAAQDHKALYDGDNGPNTGGMGAVTPVPFVTSELMQQIQTEILQPTIDGMQEEGIPFKGVLFAGLMLTDTGPKVLEYNVRFGDPETQPLMLLLDSELAPILLACINGTLTEDLVHFSDASAACVVLAAENYPENPVTGIPIEGLQTRNDPNVHVFHAGTIRRGTEIITSGGRVLGITAKAPTLADALKKAYKAIGEEGIHFDSMQYRHDIGTKATKPR